MIGNILPHLHNATGSLQKNSSRFNFCSTSSRLLYAATKSLSWKNTLNVVCISKSKRKFSVCLDLLKPLQKTYFPEK